MNKPEPSEQTPMPQNKPTRFDFAKPSGHVTRAIVIRGKGRFAIVRADPAPSAIISKRELENIQDSPRRRVGGLPIDGKATEAFEAGMQFTKDRAA